MKRAVKAWACVDKKGELIVHHIYEHKSDCGLLKVVPVTITYEVPKKAERAK